MVKCEQVTAVPMIEVPHPQSPAITQDHQTLKLLNEETPPVLSMCFTGAGGSFARMLFPRANQLDGS